MPRGHDPDAGLAGGASVVVRDGESPLQGEGGAVQTGLPRKLPNFSEVKTFDNQ